MSNSHQRLFESSIVGLLRVGEAWSEIATLSPQVVALRTDAALHAIGAPSMVPDGEPVRMVAEKIDALAASMVAAALETGLAFGRSLSGQSWPLDAVADIAVAAVAPIRERLRANVERLGGASRGEAPLAAE